ncbi:arginine--tRNA ligase [Geothrix sp. PMB-07]|uniref:arginine--tRNA ligase n=1 Tax=Geothrix sp. PMB-07 TaxID=3068640 RepID=UPI002741DE7E|nr:arginine--tRNA ligase [Geothrix sp. PMB-07]WLT32146.1 arginine--tRNA ligase [Geothrix sp. PMB-07]
MDALRHTFEQRLAAALPGVDIALERPKSGELGDLAYPCFRAAKQLGKNPAQLAQELAGAIAIEGATLVAAGPYLNLKLAPETRAQAVLGAILAAPEGRPFGFRPANGKKVIVEYSSPNIAKLFTIGHLRSTMIGHALAQTHQALGYDVIRLNHLGDWGTQFGTLLAAYTRWAQDGNADLEQDFDWAEPAPDKRRTPLFRLFQLYVRFHAEEENDPAMRDEARGWFKRLEAGDAEARRLWSWFREISLKEFQRIYDRLGVSFDTLSQGEAFYEDRLVPTMDRLATAGLLVEGDKGARIINLEDVGISTPCLVQKGDGTSIYATRDLAAALYRKEAYAFDRCLYVVGTDQVLHFQQIFAVLDKLDPWFKGRMLHTPFGMVKLPEGKMSTRKGNVIFLEDVLDEARERVAAIIDEKNPDLANKAEVAEMLGMGAVVFFDAMNDRVKPITFTWDRVIALDGDTGPYVQYAHARIMSVLRKAGGDWAAKAQAGTPVGPVVPFASAPPPADLGGLQAPEAQALLFELAGLPGAIAAVAEGCMATPLARQLVSVARSFSGYYTNCPILAPENTPAVRDARLALCVATARALRQGLFLMGIQAPEEM